jgi:hypothetical protein
MSGPLVQCPYGECPFEGTPEQVEDHVIYSTLAHIDDPEHRPEMRRPERE